MDAIPPTLPFHLARAYGVQPPAASRPVAPAQPVQRVQPGATSADAGDPRLGRLVAAVVPGGIDFAGTAPRPTTSSLPLYRHPADRNAAATSVNLGRVLDARG